MTFRKTLTRGEAYQLALGRLKRGLALQHTYSERLNDLGIRLVNNFTFRAFLDLKEMGYYNIAQKVLNQSKEEIHLRARSRLARALDMNAQYGYRLNDRGVALVKKVEMSAIDDLLDLGCLKDIEEITQRFSKLTQPESEQPHYSGRESKQ